MIGRSITKFIRSHGVRCTFELEGVAPFTLRAGPRYKRTEGLTGGMDQQLNSLAVPMPDWKERAPKKGDRVVLGGRRYAVLDSHMVEFADQGLGLKIRVKG